jgi:prefoldin subunit 5
MKEDLVDRELPDLHSSLQQNIKALNQAVNITKRSNKLRFEGLLRSVEQLKKNSRSISSALFLLESRMGKIEQVMGFYTGSDKYN